MGRVLALTTPHLQGADVRHLQEALHTNKFDSNFLGKAAIDGDFGPLTAQAVYRAEYWIGYAKPVQFCGTPLPKYLRGEMPLPLPMRDKRKARIAHAASSKPLREKAFAEALTHVGVKESPPGSNMQMFGAWYGWNGVSWCAEFVSYCYAAAGSKQIVKRNRWAYCPFIVNAARAGQFGLTVTRDPKRGDIVLYDWAGDGISDHVGLFDEWVAKGTSFRSVEGNTSPSDASNGGAVVHYGTQGFPSRLARNVQVFAHLAS